MTEQNDGEHAAWSRPDDDAGFVVVPPPQSGTAAAGSTPIVRPGHPDHPDALTGLITPRHDMSAPAGPPPPRRGHPLARHDPTSLGEPAADRPPGAPRLRWFFGAAGVLVAVGLVVVLVLAIGGSLGEGKKLPFGAGDDKSAGPPLAQACPPPTATSDPGYREGPPVPAGPRTVDSTAGISYKQYGSPWQPWTEDWVAGQLHVHYRVGQGFVTEQYARGTYMASILSGSVPATVNDGNILDLKCVGQQIVADVRGSGTKNRGYYPQPNTMDKKVDKLTTIGGLPAYESIFRLHFDESRYGLKAKSELVAVVTFDVGKPNAAVLYVSIPDTHRQYDRVIKDVIASVRRAK